MRQGIEGLEFAHGLDELVVAAQAPVVHAQVGDGAGTGRLVGVGGVAADAGRNDAGGVVAFIAFDDAGRVIIHIADVVLVKAVAQRHARILPEGVEEAEGAAGGLLFKVVVIIAHDVGIHAKAQLGVIQARVYKGQHIVGVLAGEGAVEGQLVALAEQVAFHDGAAETDFGISGVTHAGVEHTGVGFFDLDLEVHFFGVFRGHDVDIRRLEVAQLAQFFHATAQGAALQKVTVGQLDIAQDYRVARAHVAFQLHAAHKDTIFFDYLVDHIDGIFAGLVGVAVNFGKSVSEIGIKVGQDLDVVLHDRQAEVVPAFVAVIHMGHFFELARFFDKVALKSHLIDLIASAFLHGKGNHNAVFLVIHLGRGHPHIQKTVVEIIGVDGRDIALQVFLAQNAAARDPGNNAPFGQGQLVLNIALGKLGGAFHVHIFNIQAPAFIHIDNQRGATVGRGHAVRDLGQIIAVFTVKFGDFLQVLHQHLVIENGAGLGAHGRQNVILVHFAVALDRYGANARLFLHLEHQHQAFGLFFQLGLHVVKIAKLPNFLHFTVNGGPVNGVAAAHRQTHQHHVRVQGLGAFHLHIGQHLARYGHAGHAVSQLVHRAHHVGHALAFHHNGHARAVTLDRNQTAVNAVAVAHLGERSVHRVGGAHFGGYRAHGGKVQRTNLHPLQNFSGGVRIKHRHALGGKTLDNHALQLAAQLVHFRPAINLEWKYHYPGRVLLRGPLGLGHRKREAGEQTNQGKYTGLKRFVHIILRP